MDGWISSTLASTSTPTTIPRLPLRILWNSPQPNHPSVHMYLFKSLWLLLSWGIFSSYFFVSYVDLASIFGSIYVLLILPHPSTSPSSSSLFLFRCRIVCTASECPYSSFVESSISPQLPPSPLLFHMLSYYFPRPKHSVISPVSFS